MLVSGTVIGLDFTPRVCAPEQLDSWSQHCGPTSQNRHNIWSLFLQVGLRKEKIEKKYKVQLHQSILKSVFSIFFFFLRRMSFITNNYCISITQHMITRAMYLFIYFSTALDANSSARGKVKSKATSTFLVTKAAITPPPPPTPVFNVIYEVTRNNFGVTVCRVNMYLHDHK